MFFERNQKKSKVLSLEVIIHCSSNVNSLLTLQRKTLQSLPHDFSTLINEHHQLLHMIDHFLAFVAENFFIPLGFHIFLHCNKNMARTFLR